MKIQNPDPEKIYHVWHYCAKCKQTFTHSQGAWDEIRHIGFRGGCCRDNLMSVSTEKNSVTIDD